MKSIDVYKTSPKEIIDSGETTLPAIHCNASDHRIANQENESFFSLEEENEALKHKKYNKTKSDMIEECMIPPANPLLPKSMFMSNQPIKAKFRLNVQPDSYEGDKKKKHIFIQDDGEENPTKFDDKNKKFRTQGNNNERPDNGTKTPLRMLYRSQNSKSPNLNKIKKYEGESSTSKDLDDSEREISPLKKKLYYPTPDEIIAEVIKEESFRKIIKLEQKQLQGINPIVYSRNGKSKYDAAKDDPKSFYDISFKDLQILISNLERKYKQLAFQSQKPSKLTSGTMSPTKKEKLQSLSAPRNSTNNLRREKYSPPSDYYIPQDEDDETLVFESRFESGNLQLAMKISETEYNLILQNDLNTTGNTQWFYFTVSNTRKNSKIKFNIINFAKDGSLFNDGMKVSVFSKLRNEKEKMCWYKGGENISYFSNNFKKVGTLESNKRYKTMTFTFTFPFDFDTVAFAYSEPYTYSDLVDFIDDLEENAYVKDFNLMTREVLTTTVAGHDCEMLTITNPESQIKKQAIVLTARVHPGECVASWMIEGAIEFLCSTSEEAQKLRDNFIFKIIPMINPDGVIQGNYRCSLTGNDLNRRYAFPSKVLHPTIFALKKLVRSYSKEVPIVAYIDFHGHSKSKDVFVYGNTDYENPEQFRIFPFILDKMCKHFSFKASKFAIQKSKLSCSRIVMWKELNSPHIFTVEASFYGPSNRDEGMDPHFSLEDLKDVGKNVCQAFLVAFKISNVQDKQKSILPNPFDSATSTTIGSSIGKEKDNPGEEICYEEMMKELIDNKETFIKTEEESNDEGSDSNPSEDNIDAQNLLKLIQKKKKKKAPSSSKKKDTTPRIKNTQPYQRSATQKNNNKINIPVINSKESSATRQYNPKPQRSSLPKNPREHFEYIEVVDAWTQTFESDFPIISFREATAIGFNINLKSTNVNVETSNGSSTPSTNILYSSYKNYRMCSQLNPNTSNNRNYSPEIKYKPKTNTTSPHAKKYWEKEEKNSFSQAHAALEMASNSNSGKLNTNFSHLLNISNTSPHHNQNSSKKPTTNNTLSLLKIIGNPNINSSNRIGMSSKSPSQRIKIYQGSLLQKSGHKNKDAESGMNANTNSNAPHPKTRAQNDSHQNRRSHSTVGELMLNKKVDYLPGFKNFRKKELLIERNKIKASYIPKVDPDESYHKTSVSINEGKSGGPTINRKVKTRLEKLLSKNGQETRKAKELFKSFQVQNAPPIKCPSPQLHSPHHGKNTSNRTCSQKTKNSLSSLGKKRINSIDTSIDNVFGKADMIYDISTGNSINTNVNILEEINKFPPYGKKPDDKSLKQIVDASAFFDHKPSGMNPERLSQELAKEFAIPHSYTSHHSKQPSGEYYSKIHIFLKANKEANNPQPEQPNILAFYPKNGHSNQQEYVFLPNQQSDMLKQIQKGANRLPGPNDNSCVMELPLNNNLKIKVENNKEKKMHSNRKREHSKS